MSTIGGGGESYSFNQKLSSPLQKRASFCERIHPESIFSGSLILGIKQPKKKVEIQSIMQCYANVFNFAMLNNSP